MIYNERRSLPIWKRILVSILSIVMIALQLAVFTVMVLYTVRETLDFTIGMSILYIITEVLGFILVLTIIKRRINTNYKLTWCILIMLAPVFFGPFYLLNLTSRHLSRRKRTLIHEQLKQIPLSDVKEELKDDNPRFYNMANVVNNIQLAPVLKNSKFKFYPDIAIKDQDMFLDLKNAKRTIYLEYFIISPGKLTDELYEILKERGEAGVKIKILYDDIGCRGHNNGKIIKMLAGIKNCEVCPYQPFGINFNILVNYRNHRKLCIIDSVIAYCGGDNLADEYAHIIERFGYWRDNCSRYEGEAALSFAIQFGEMWYASTKEVLRDYEPEIIPQFEGYGYVMPFTDGPLFVGDSTYNLFLSMITNAKKCVYISTPYFIIDETMIDVICMKCKEGLDVKILMPGKPDKRTAFYMSRENYSKIIRAGGEIYEMSRGFNHAKNIMVDGRYAFAGTANMDYRSLYLHFECGALIMDSPEISVMEDDFLKEIENADFITYEKFKKRPWYQKFIAFIFNLFAPVF